MPRPLFGTSGWNRPEPRCFIVHCSVSRSGRRYACTDGNIGPVLEALVGELQSDEPVIVCLAFPANGRTVFQGHLFVGARLISESGMAHHPLTPMTDFDIRRWLAYQTQRGVGHLDLSALRRDVVAVLRQEAGAGRTYVIANAVSVDDLHGRGGAWACRTPLAVLLANHGSVVAGAYIEAAVTATEELEEAGRLALLTHGLSPRLLSPEQARDIVSAFNVEWD